MTSQLHLLVPDIMPYFQTLFRSTHRDHDERILDSIAEGTNGTFTFVRNNTEVKEAVAQTLGGALSVAVQATTVELTAAPGVAILSVSAGAYGASVDEAQASATIDLKVGICGPIL